MHARSRFKRLFYFLRRQVDSPIEIIIWATVIWLVAFAGQVHSAPLQQQQANALYAIAYGHAGIGIPERAPTVRQVPQSAIADRYCGRPCPISAVHFATEVWIDEALDMSNPIHASIVLHELVHYVQWAMRGEATDCETHRAREVQAYSIQAYALDQIGLRMARPEIPVCI